MKRRLEQSSDEKSRKSFSSSAICQWDVKNVWFRFGGCLRSILSSRRGKCKLRLKHGDTKGAIESVRIKGVEFKEAARAFFLQGKSKLSVIMRCPYYAGFDCS